MLTSPHASTRADTWSCSAPKSRMCVPCVCPHPGSQHTTRDHTCVWSYAYVQCAVHSGNAYAHEMRPHIFGRPAKVPCARLIAGAHTRSDDSGSRGGVGQHSGHESRAGEAVPRRPAQERGIPGTPGHVINSGSHISHERLMRATCMRMHARTVAVRRRRRRRRRCARARARLPPRRQTQQPGGSPGPRPRPAHGDIHASHARTIREMHMRTRARTAPSASSASDVPPAAGAQPPAEMHISMARPAERHIRMAPPAETHIRMAPLAEMHIRIAPQAETHV